MRQKLIELWKNDCEHCEATEPLLKQVISYPDKAPAKEEIIKLTEGGEEK